MKSDAQLKKDVTDELRWDAEVEETKIGISVTNGAVTLTGHVPSYRQKIAAADAVKRVSGVLAVVNNIDVQIESIHRTTDEGLAERIANVLKWNVSIPGKEIKADVKNGVVTLMGDLDWQYQRNNVLRNIQHVGGVVNVIDLMKVKPRVVASDVQKRIREALQRHVDVEASKITVSVADGTVTLAGTVDSVAEMDRIEDAAWTAPGVTKVVDNLRVA